MDEARNVRRFTRERWQIVFSLPEDLGRVGRLTSRDGRTYWGLGEHDVPRADHMVHDPEVVVGFDYQRDLAVLEVPMDDLHRTTEYSSC